jgi:hypothetical protein
MSRCSTPARWATESAANLVEHPPHMTRSTGPPATRSARLCPGSRSITMNGARDVHPRRTR